LHRIEELVAANIERGLPVARFANRVERGAGNDDRSSGCDCGAVRALAA
jgi:hypothetical protein